MRKALFALPFVALSLVAARDVAPPAPALTVVPPAAIAADPANKLTLELSNGGKVVILLRPDAALDVQCNRVGDLLGERGKLTGGVEHNEAMEPGARDCRSGFTPR